MLTRSIAFGLFTLLVSATSVMGCSDDDDIIGNTGTLQQPE